MNNTILLHNPLSPRAQRAWLCSVLFAAALAVSGLATADEQGHNQLQSVNAQQLAGDRIELAFQLSGPAPQPLAFTVNQPARISLDLADTRLSLKSRKTDVQQGMVNSVVAAEAGDRTRIVINLTALVPYVTSVQGNTLYVLIGASAGDTSVASADVSGFGPPSTGPAAASGASVPSAKLAPAPTAVAAVPVPAATASAAKVPAAKAPVPAALAVANPGPNQIAGVDFRRGADGSGDILVTLPNPGIIGNVHEQNGNVVVDFSAAKLPEELVHRIDVTDFATPVQYIDVQNTPAGAQLVVHLAGQYEKLAYQTDDTFSVEFKPPSATAANQVETKRQYTGQKISLNFQSIDIRAVLQILADASGKNVVVSDSVNGNITLRLQDVPWDQALDIILKTKGLATRQYGNVLMVGTAGEVSTQEQAEAAAQQSLAQVEPLESAFIQVNYAKALDLQTLVKGSGANSMLSKRGSVTVDARTNTLLVQDTADNINTIRNMVERLDVAVKQVLIESRVVIANNDISNDLGVRLGYTGTRDTKNTFMTTSGTLAGTDSQVSEFVSQSNTVANAVNSGCGAATNPCPLGPGFTVPALANRLNVNIPAVPDAGSIAFSVLRGNSIIDLELSALQSEGQGEVVSSPRVMTADQKTAHIEQGVEIPYQQSSASGATTTSFKDAVLSLDVTPQITPDQRIIMDLEVHDDQVGQNVQSATGGTVPSIDTRDVKTQVLVNNGDTVVMGGIYETTKSSTITKVPLLGDIPLLGWLFRTSSTTDNKDELLVFVTPKIVDQAASTAVAE